MAESLHDQSANGVHFFVAELRAEHLVEIFNRGQGAHRIGLTVQLTDIAIFFVVILIFDFADDQLKDILDGDQAGDAAEFINNDRHMIALRTKLFQHAVDALAFRHHNRRAQHFFHAERL